MPTKSALPGLAGKLVAADLMDETQARTAVAEANKAHQPFVAYLASQKEVDMQAVAKTAMQAFGLPWLDIQAFDLHKIPSELVKASLIEQHFILPLVQRKKKLYVAMADPSNLQALDDIKFQMGVVPEPILVEANALEYAIAGTLKLADEELDLSDIDMSGVDKVHATDEHINVDDAPLVQYINKILRDAIKKGASDIHFEPYERSYRIRIRRDGVLKEMAQPAVELGPRLCARLKVLSRLNLSERRIPQDGRFKLNLGPDEAIDFRVNTCPTLFGEKVVLRILDPTSAKIGIDALGYEPNQKKLFLDAIHRPQGMILVTGPTGSGKTVSLYTALNILNTPEVNISTAEDPVEINLPGINQVNVSSKVGLTFAAALKAFLRQDPDIVMVGEIRDLETAETAVKAAQTGHLVLSTLHTNSAPETIVRLMNMGIPPYNLATALALVIAQRLARRLCEKCKKPADLPKEALIQAGFSEEELASATLFEANGCDECSDGYKGRVGLYEVMPISKETSKIIMAGGNVIDIINQAKTENIINLTRAGLNKVAKGLTTLEEVLRVTKE